MAVVNVFTLLGVALGLIGVVLVVQGVLGAFRAAIRRIRYRRPLTSEGGTWSNARPSWQVYVPGSIGRGFTRAFLGVVIVALGLPFAWTGIELGRAYVAIGEPAMLLRLTVPSPGRLRLEPRGGAAVEGSTPGPLLVGHAEAIEFRGPLAKLGLGSFARATHIAGYRDSAAVLARRGIARLEVAGPHRLSALVDWAGRSLGGWVKLERRFSPPLRQGVSEAELWMGPSGLEWRY